MRSCRCVFAALPCLVVAGAAVVGAEEGAGGPLEPVGDLVEVGRARTGSMPKGVTVSPDGRTLAVTNFGERWGENVMLYDAATLERVRTVRLRDSNPVESAWSPDGATLYVSDFTNHRVVFLDPATLEVRSEVGVDHHPKIVTLSPDGERLYASCWGDGTVVEVLTATATRGRTVEVGRHPRGSAVSPDGSTLWVANYGSDEVHEIDLGEFAVRRVLALPRRSYPRHAVLDRAGVRLFVSGKNADAVFVIDTAAWEVTAEIPVGRCPKSLGLSPDERTLYTANYCSHDVSVVELATGGVRRVRVDGLREGSGLAVSADGRRVWVTGWSSKDLVALEPTGGGAVPGAAVPSAE